ncbi:lysozyme inhibitor LprI family protein [Microbulbifer aggregans]|uniref:lysozyme inhibitor LprI family protein n=1 Tax=Microbulbifer aggregans TaxID=1769779 RepID=UPI001CFD555E|nr:lysozyme inhibitor LprI family protein [Microbulbifer aggregans]
MKLSTFIIFLIFSSLSFAEKFAIDDGAFYFEATEITDCMSLGSRSSYTMDCLEFFDSSARNALEREFSKLSSKLTRDTDELNEAQRKWVEFADAQCKLEAAVTKSYAESDIEWNRLNKICLQNQYLARINYLKSIDTECAGCIK